MPSKQRCVVKKVKQAWLTNASAGVSTTKLKIIADLGFVYERESLLLTVLLNSSTLQQLGSVMPSDSTSSSGTLALQRS